MFRVELHGWAEAERSRRAAPVESALVHKADQLLAHAGLQKHRLSCSNSRSTVSHGCSNPVRTLHGGSCAMGRPEVVPVGRGQWTWDASDAPTAAPWNGSN